MWKLGGEAEIGTNNSTRQNFIPLIVCGFPRSEQRRIMAFDLEPDPKCTVGKRLCNNIVITSFFPQLSGGEAVEQQALPSCWYSDVEHPS